MPRKVAGAVFFDHLTLIKWLGEYQGPPISSEEIARQMGYEWSTVRAWMQVLQKLGMVRMQPNAQDHRRLEWISLYNITQRETNAPIKVKPSLQAYLDSRGLSPTKPPHLTQAEWEQVQRSAEASSQQNRLGGIKP